MACALLSSLSGLDGTGAARENERRTSGESSASTLRARRAEEARRCVGKGIEIVLGAVRSRLAIDLHLYLPTKHMENQGLWA